MNQQENIRNTALTSKDARRDELMHGKEITKLWSSSTRIKHKLSMPIIMDVPRNSINTHQKVQIFIDMHVNKVPFLNHVSRAIGDAGCGEAPQNNTYGAR